MMANIFSYLLFVLNSFRHEMPEENKDLAKQNIKDRYHGVNDPVAKKILNRTRDMRPSLAPPEDRSVVGIYSLRQRNIYFF